ASSSALINKRANSQVKRDVRMGSTPLGYWLYKLGKKASRGWNCSRLQHAISEKSTGIIPVPVVTGKPTTD
ncbi:MAG: hypothetical protein WBO46_12625, partial [Caldilineaceae bacterium]